MAVYRSDQAQLTFVTESAAGAYPENASSVTQSVALNGLSPATTVGPAAAQISGSGNLVVDAVHSWKCTYTVAGVESVGSAASANHTVVASNLQMTITPPVGPTGTTIRKIYRNQNGGTSWHLVGQLTNEDNTASQTLVDNVADASLGNVIPSTSQLTADTAAGASSIAVDSNRNFSVGDLIQIGPLVGSTITPGAVYNIRLNNESEIRRVDYKDGTTGLTLDVPTGFWHGDNTFVHVVTAIADVTNDQYINLVPGVYETVDVPDPDMTIEARYFLGTQSKRNFFQAYKGQQTFTGSVPGFILLDGRALRYPIGKVTSTTQYVSVNGAGSTAPHSGMVIAGALQKGDTFVTVDAARLANSAGTVAQNAYLLFTGQTTVPATTTISNATTEIRQHIGAASATLLQLDYPLQYAHADNEIILYITQAEASTTLAVAGTTVPYTHAITETVDLDTVSWHLHMRDSSETAANDFDRRYYGGMIGGATLSADEGGMLTMSWDGVNFQGMVHNQEKGSASGTETVPFYTKMQKIDADGINFPSTDPYYFSQGEVTIFGQTIARVRNFSLSIANNEEPRYYIQRRHQRHRGPSEIREQRREYSLALTLALPDTGAPDSATTRLFNELLWEGDYGAGSGTGMVGFNIALSFIRGTGDSITITIPDDGTAAAGGNNQGAFIRTAPHAITGDNPLQVDADVLFRSLKIDVLDNTHYYP